MFGHKNKYETFICCNDKNISSSDYEYIENEILNVINTKLGSSDKLLVYFTSNDNMYKNTYKSSVDADWINEYIAYYIMAP